MIFDTFRKDSMLEYLEEEESQESQFGDYEEEI